MKKFNSIWPLGNGLLVLGQRPYDSSQIDECPLSERSSIDSLWRVFLQRLVTQSVSASSILAFFVVGLFISGLFGNPGKWAGLLFGVLIGQMLLVMIVDFQFRLLLSDNFFPRLDIVAKPIFYDPVYWRLSRNELRRLGEEGKNQGNLGYWRGSRAGDRGATFDRFSLFSYSLQSFSFIPWNHHDMAKCLSLTTARLAYVPVINSVNHRRGGVADLSNCFVLGFPIRGKKVSLVSWVRCILLAFLFFAICLSTVSLRDTVPCYWLIILGILFWDIVLLFFSFHRVEFAELCRLAARLKKAADLP